MRILFVGDILGRPGRRALRSKLAGLCHRESIDLAVANCENAAGGFGVTPKIAALLLASGLDVLTSGNHIWDKKEILPFIETEPRLLRPDNYPDAPGTGVYVGHSDGGIRFAVVNLQGRVYLPSIDCPFRRADRVLAQLDPDVRIRIVDFHAEVTSEKNAMAVYLDGRVTAVVGTHTHVQTADARVLPGGTAFITDVGMTGPHSSVIGMAPDAALRRFLTGMPARFKPAKGPVQLNAVVIEVNEGSGSAVDIRRISEVSA